jgi:CRISPR-associated endonuclease/helicase Cas3
VRPLAECIARPGEGPRGLIIHLEAVAAGAGRKDGSAEEKLAFLGGLAHDAAKAAEGWQEYIRSSGRIRRGPPHAPLGAALFAFWAEDLVPRWESDRHKREQLFDLALDWVRMVYRHHGALDDLDDHPPWVDPGMKEEHQPAPLLATCDCPGLDALVREHFECERPLAEFADWLREHDVKWRRRSGVVRSDLLRRASAEQRDQIGLRLADLGARLIFADRRHAAEWEPDSFDREQAETAICRHAEACRGAAQKDREKGADESILRARQQRQEEALGFYRQSSAADVFSLLLPTGYGKTLTGLRVALEAVRAGRCRRVVYVAPYISILAQAAGDIEGATGLPVVLHHHLSILGSNDCPEEDRQREDHQSYDLLDTWQAPVVATTFNQLFRALFPARAQECLRIPALEESFVFIDEPQIVDPVVWSAFLRALATRCRTWRCQVLFCTATLPPVADGLGSTVAVVPLARDVKPVTGRYVIRSSTDVWQPADVAREARQRLEKRRSAAVILNTVRDAVDVYQQLGGEAQKDWLFLAALMLPGHKAQIVQTIHHRLTAESAKAGVVCTQVLEAGVNLSFRALLRARPIFSSVAQAAGRANRHGEGERAEVIVFTFLRTDGKDSRKWIYGRRKKGEPENHATTEMDKTDALLAERPELLEEELPGALAEYYSRCWAANPHLTSLQWFGAAARGKWSELAGKEPFGGDYPKVAVFVPGAERFLAAGHRAVLESFGTDTAEELLALSLDPASRRKLDFLRRKQLAALLRQFTVSVPARVASRVADPVGNEEDAWLWQLNDPRFYSDATGLAHHLTAEDAADPSCVVL